MTEIEGDATDRSADLRFRIALKTEATVEAVAGDAFGLLGYCAADFLDGSVNLRRLIHRDDEDIAERLFSSPDSIVSATWDFNVRLRQANGRIRCFKGHAEQRNRGAWGGRILDLLLQDAKTLRQQMGTVPISANSRAMLENTDDYIYFKDRNHVFTGASQTLVSITSPAEHWTDLLGKTDYDVFPEELADVYYALEKRVFAGAPVAREVQRILTTGGEGGWVDNRKYPVHDETGEIVGLFGVARDITEAKRMEEALAKSERRFRSIFEQVPSVAVQGYDRARRVIFWNRASERLYGYTRAEALGQRREELLVPDSQREAAVDEFEQWVEAGNVAPATEKVLLCADGLPVEVLTSYVVLHDRSAQPEVYCFDIDVSERKQSARDLQRERQLFLSVIDSLPGIFYMYSYPEGRLVLRNQRYETLLGYEPRDFIDHRMAGWVAPEAKGMVFDAIEQVMNGGRPSDEGEVVVPLIAKDGRRISFSMTGARFETGEESYFLGVGIDVTERLKLEQAEKEALDRLRKIASRVPGVVYQYRVFPDGRTALPYASAALREIFHFEPEELREDASALLSVIHPEDIDEVRASISRSGEALSVWKQDFRVRFADGTVRWLSGNSVPEREEGGSLLWYGFITDVTERKALEEQVRQMAFHDVLTELPNRRLFSDRLSQAMAATSRSGLYGAVMFLDLDNFKPLNDLYGHEAGDKLLGQVAARLKRCVRPMDTVARFGGDEFAVMIAELEDDKAKSAAAAARIAESIRHAISEPYLVSVHTPEGGTGDKTVEYRCSASIGVNLFSGYLCNQEEILRVADDAMYRAKETGRNAVHVAPLLPIQNGGAGASGGVGFADLNWYPEYESGNALIDTQHRTLFDDANGLLSAVLAERPPSEISTLIDLLLSDVAGHFDDEEHILATVAYPDANAHKALHGRLVTEAQDFAARYRSGNLAVGELFQFIMRDVLAQHLLQADREFFPYLRPGKGQAKSSEDASVH